MGEKMTKYYHFTSYSNLENINEIGLIPQNGDRCKAINDKKCAIFLSRDIAGAIIMYCAIRWHFNQYLGNKGLYAIQDLRDSIRHYGAGMKKYDGSTEFFNENIKRALDEIECIKHMRQYASFDEFIGEGCYLSISNIRNVDKVRPEDCIVYKTINPSKISVVTLRNKYTGETIDSIEPVMSYFMSTIPWEKLVSNLTNVIAQKQIMKLYHERYDEIMIYGYENYTLEEIPITEYINQKRKMLK